MVEMIHGSLVAFLPNLSASSFPRIFVWAITFRMVMLCEKFVTMFIMGVTRSLSGWLNREEGFLTWLNNRYILLRLFVKMYVSVVSVLV